MGLFRTAFLEGWPTRARAPEVAPLERETPVPTTAETAFQAQITDFWSQLQGVAFSPRLIERVWVANRCIELNSQEIASMPLRFHGGREPAWVANPDPVWFPNGISDAVYACIDSMYRWGDAFIVITSRYADGYPSAWTLAQADTVEVEVRRGRRVYRANQQWLNPADVVQVSRNPRGNVRGTSLIKSYGSQAFGLLAANDLGRVMMRSDVPQYALKALRKLDEGQAKSLQNEWVSKTSDRRGAPPVVPPEIELQKLSFSVADLMLLDSQKFDAQVLASAAGVPALFLNLPIEGGLNYQSPAMLGEHWWRFELRTMATLLSNAMSSQMLPAGSGVVFDAREILAPTFNELVVAVTKLVEDGIITVEEARVLLRLPAEQAQEALQQLLTPPSAGASPAQQPPSVIELRPQSAAGT
jgi:HK97 family phage portal protein